MDALTKQSKSKKVTNWSRKTESFCGGDLIKVPSFIASLEAYQFKNRDTLQDTEELQLAFSKSTGKYGIYFLFNHKREKVYVGKTEARYQRLIQHDTATSEWYFKDWDEAVLFVTHDNSMQDDDMKNLEAIFIKYFKNIEDVIRLNRKNEKIETCEAELHGDIIRKPLIEEAKQINYIIAIKDKLIDMKLLNKNAEIELVEVPKAEEVTQDDIDRIIEYAKADIIKDNEIKINDDALNYRKLKLYEKDRRAVRNTSNLIKFNRIIQAGFNNKGLDEVVTPQSVADNIVNMLPNEVFDGKHSFLDLACKSGIFLKLIIEKLMSDDKDLPINHNPDFKDKQERLRYIIDNLIFGIALSQNGKLISKDAIYQTIEGFQKDKDLLTEEKVNTIPRIIELNNYKNSILRKDDNKYKDLKERIAREFKKQGALEESMKFGVIIGNPPYQEDVSKENGGGRQTKPIYDKFIEAAINLSSDNGYVAMITNNTFLTNDAKSDIRNKMIDAGLSVLVNYPISGEIFNGIGVSACHFLIDKNNKEHKFIYNKIEHSEIVNTYESILKTDDLILESKYEFEIPNKVKDTKSMGDISLGVKTFGIGVNGRIGFDGKGAFVNILKSKLDNCITIKNKISVNGIGYIYKRTA